MNNKQLQIWEATKKNIWSVKGLFIAIAVVFFFLKDVSIEVGMSNVVEAPTLEAIEPMQTANLAKNVSHHMAAKLVPTEMEKVEKKTPAAKSSKISSSLANTYSNLTYSDPKLGKVENTAARTAKIKKQRAYVKKYADVAIQEMHKYGIPASITLAQGLIESNCGESRLATNNNNHFGMKCFSKKCKKGHCSNFTDDSHKDFFRKYKSSWESYRAHSILLQNARYKPLYKIPKSDYKGWARGLKKAGYATDPLYGEKLINLIKNLNLQQYDQ